MDSWEKALNDFLEPWKSSEDVWAAIATGSYVVNNNTYKSDIDVHIILANQIDWRERGNKLVDGYLIEYFANPLRQIIQYLNEGLREGTRTDSNMFSNGKVIFDKNGVTKELIKRAKLDLEKGLDNIDPVSLELIKYHIWDLFKEIQEAFESNSPCYHYLYNNYLEMILDKYARFLKAILPSKYKIYRFFTDKEYAQRYNIKAFPDYEFVKKYVECIEEQEIKNSYQSVSELKEYVLNAMGGFEIDGWSLRTTLSVNLSQ